MSITRSAESIICSLGALILKYYSAFVMNDCKLQDDGAISAKKARADVISLD